MNVTFFYVLSEFFSSMIVCWCYAMKFPKIFHLVYVNGDEINGRAP